MSDAEHRVHVLAGTGSRSLQIADRDVKNAAVATVDALLSDARQAHGSALVVMSGMAEGFDKLLALRALRLEIDLWCAIPNRGYGTYYWARRSLTGQDRSSEFNAIVARAWRVTHVMEDVHRHRELYLNGQHANFVRNQFMVDHADEFVVWDPTSAGTSNCLTSIIKAGVAYRVISPA